MKDSRGQSVASARGALGSCVWLVFASIAGCGGEARNLDSSRIERDADSGTERSDAGLADSGARQDGDDTGPLGPPAFDGPTYTGISAEPSDRAAFLFDPQVLRSYEILIAPEDLAHIDADPRAEQYVPGMLRFEEQEFGPVGIRYKGSVGAFRNCVGAGGEKTCTKLSMKVAFDRPNRDGRFHGLRKLQFHAMNRDPSMLRERLGYAMFREFGLAAPRAVHARLLINGRLVGLFALVEQIDGRFTRSRFREGGEGNLYKEAWPTNSENRAIAEPALRMRLTTNEDENPSLETMLGFGRAIEEASLADLPDALAAYTDLEYAMSYVAVDRTIAHDDGPFHWYCFGICYNHNYYWYEARDDARLWLIAWDLDNTFTLNNLTTTLWFPWDDATRGCAPLTQPPFMLPLRAPTCDKLTLGWARMQARYLERVETFLGGPFTSDNVEAKLQAWEAQIAPAVAEAAALHADAPSMAAWAEARDALRASIAELRDRARARLAQGPIEVRDPREPLPPDAGTDAEPDPDLDDET
jgi:hypothetical protein